MWQYFNGTAKYYSTTRQREKKNTHTMKKQTEYSEWKKTNNNISHCMRFMVAFVLF